MYLNIIKCYCIILDTYIQSIFITKHLVCNGSLNTIIDPRGIYLINIEWQRNGQKIDNTSHYTLTDLKLDKSEYGFQQQLLINSIKTSLAGIYSCVAWIGNDKTRNMTANTTVTVQSEL